MRSIICNKILQAVGSIHGEKGRLKSSHLLPFIKVWAKPSVSVEFEVNLQKLNKQLSTTHDSALRSLLSEPLDVSQLIEKFPTDDTVTGVYYKGKLSPSIIFKVCQQKLLKEVITNICNYPEGFWLANPLLNMGPKQKYLIEFSSPNIAKPFHIGHLRSTVIGNFIANLLQALGHQVIKINYLGDWGTQFGLLKYGYDLKHMTEEDLKNDPMRSLYSLYVWVNQEAERSPHLLEEAKRLFRLLEEGVEQHLKVWRTFRDLSIEAYIRVYRRLNVAFDEYHGESMYSMKRCEDVLRALEERGLLISHPDGRKLFAEDEVVASPVTLVKSDGTTLYLTRDVAAAVDRFATYRFDRMLYVVDTSQRAHFASLKRILAALEVECTSAIEHVPFGRIPGMSTRKGSAVFLDDVLNEARDLWKTAQEKDRYTEFSTSEEAQMAADVSGSSAVAVAFLRLRRTRNYTFNWQETLKTSGKFSSSFQYTNCRLLRLERNCGVSLNDEVTTETLEEPEVTHLLRLIVRFEEIVRDAYERLESAGLVQYLDDLSRAINSCYAALPVRSAPPQSAQERLKLFRAARFVLAAGMRILGLRPLERM